MMLIWVLLILFIAAPLSLALGAIHSKYARLASLIALCIDGVLVASMWLTAEQSPTTIWLYEIKLPWIPQIGASLHLAIDGISLLLLALTIFLGIMGVICSWKAITERVGLFHFNLLFVLAGVSLVFMALDLFLFYFAWELMLIPTYFLIALWGYEQRQYAATKFFLFTQCSGLFLLAATLALYTIHGQTTGHYTFDYPQLIGTTLTPTAATWIMLGFLIAFLVKLPAIPFHTWLPDAHTQAPAAGSLDLAGLLIKTGAYGLIRFVLPLFPEQAASFAPIAWALGITGILYGAGLAFIQTDLKRLIAYSSISHMGFVLVGIFSGSTLGLQGALILMLAHGISTGALFIVAGNLRERLLTRDLTKMGGLWKEVPTLGGIALFFTMASLGLPGLGNFVGEFLVLLGIYHTSVVTACLAACGFVLTVTYTLSLMQRTFYGPAPKRDPIPDLSLRELSIFIFMMAASVWIGLFPAPFFKIFAPAINNILTVQE